MIEPCWYWMKIETSKQGAPTSRKEALYRWRKAWKNLPQEKIQQWILRLQHHIKEVIRLDGDNNYEESCKKYYKAQSCDVEAREE